MIKVRFGKNFYIYDEEKRVVINDKTKRELKWQYSNGAMSILKLDTKIKPENVNRFVYLHNGKGDRLKIYECQFKGEPIIPGRRDM